MRMMSGFKQLSIATLSLFLCAASSPSLAQITSLAQVEKPAALIADGIPNISPEMVAKTRPYMEFRTAAFRGWNASDKSILISTRFGNTAQLHRVAMPMGARTQISFEAEPLGGSWSPKGDLLLVTKDTGGNEFFQIYTLKDGKLTLLSDGKSRNSFQGWNKDGSLIGFSSTRRNGRDSDLYVMNPRDPSSARMVAEVKGGGWNIIDFSSDSQTALVGEYVSVTKTDLYILDLTTGKLTAVGDHSKSISYGDGKFAPDNSLWVTSDEGADFKRLGKINTLTGAFTPMSTESKWDIDGFDIADDGTFIAYVINEAGIDRLKILTLKSNSLRTVTNLPAGSIGSVNIAPWGEIGLSFTSARSASDVFSVDPVSLALTRWTQSETGGLDLTQNAEPEFITLKSFDGESVSGFLYRPDPAKFPGKRPLIINVHGGPESQSKPGFLGRNNYLVNEMGIAIFFPNIRGSTGMGKRFVNLDNGPFLRENSVKDIGAFIDILEKDNQLDKARFALTGGSYGGYVCYASAIRFGAQLKGANCVVAISNFVTFLENTQSYRRDLRRVEYGDERDPKQRAKLLEISPMSRVAQLNIPLMVVTGANDPRVPKSEADQMVAAVRAKGGMAWHLVGMDEGHGFAKKVNQDYQFWVNLMFWQQTLLPEVK